MKVEHQATVVVVQLMNRAKRRFAQTGVCARGVRGWSCVHDARLQQGGRFGPIIALSTGVLPLLGVSVASWGYDLAVVKRGDLSVQ